MTAVKIPIGFEGCQTFIPRTKLNFPGFPQTTVVSKTHKQLNNNNHFDLILHDSCSFTHLLDQSATRDFPLWFLACCCLVPKIIYYHSKSAQTCLGTWTQCLHHMEIQIKSIFLSRLIFCRVRDTILLKILEIRACSVTLFNHLFDVVLHSEL